MRSDRVVLITGAAGGIGVQLVRRFLDNGDTVVALDSKKAALDQLAETVGRGERLVTQVVDVTDETAITAAAELVRGRGAGLDVLITCHGYFPRIPFEQLTSQDFRHIVDINLTGTFLVLHPLLPLMKGKNWGRIITFGSGSMFEGPAGFAPYVAAKSGVVGMCRSLSREVGTHGITVNTVTPGLTATPVVVENFPSAALADQLGRRALPRDQRADDLVGAVFFLASPDADFVTGQILNVDGGSHLH